MKKIKTMRIASILLIAVLMTTCAISGTFAKYVTSASATDTARVAKWGVTVTATTGSDFAKTYQTHDDVYTGAISVEAEDKVVAPGTSSADVDGDVTFTIAGKPEVATRVTIEFEATSEIILEKNTAYLDYTTGNDTQDTFTLDADYYPVKFTLTQEIGDATTTLVNAGTLQDVAEALTGVTDYDPNETLDVTYTLTWEWDFGEDENNDKADTYLGQEEPAQTLGYTLNITVEQID